MGIHTTKLLIVSFLLIPSLVYGAAIQGLEEGSVVGYCKSIDFVGGSQTLTASGLDCTLTSTAYGGEGTGDVDSVGDCSSGACLDGTSDGGTWIKFYDAQGAGQLITGDLTEARVWTMPDATGTVALTSGLHAAVTLAGQDYLSLSTQEITANLINGDNINWSTVQDLVGDTQINWASVQGITGSNINWSLIDEDVITGINWTAYEDTNTTYTAGRSLTLDGTTINADAELYTSTISFVLESPTDADAFLIWKAPHAITVTDIDCIVGAATSAVIDIQECDSAGANCATVDATITCDADGAADDGTLSNGGIDAGDWLKLDIGTVTGTVKYVSGTVTFTRND